jgi:hypothetical protein
LSKKSKVKFQVNQKKILVIIAAIAVFIVGLFYFFTPNFLTGKRNALDLVAPEAILVFETNEPVMAWNQLVTQDFWDRLVELPAFEQAEDQIMALDSLLGKSGRLEKALKGNQFVVSLHPVGREEFDFLYTIAFKNRSDFGILEELEANLPPLSQINTRNYSNVTIKEFQSLDLERNLTYSILGNVLVASYNSFLVEESIRYAQNRNLDGFKGAHRELFNALPSPKGLGVIRVSSQGLGRMIGSITREADLKLLETFSRKAISANLELRFQDQKIHMEGRAFFPKGNEFDFSVGKDSNAKVFQNLISNRTAVLHQYTIEDEKQLATFSDPGFQFTSTLKGDVEKELVGKNFFQQLTGNLALILFELIPNEPQDRVLLIQTKEKEEVLQMLKNFNQSLDRQGTEDQLVDFYLNHEIFIISADEFPAHLFGGKFQGFPDTYLTVVQDYLIMANSSKAMKLFLDDVANDNTWGKSISQKVIADKLNDESGFQFMVNLPRFWSNVLEKSSPNWRPFFQKYAAQFKSFELIDLKVVETGRNNLVTINWEYTLDPVKAAQDILLSENLSVEFPNLLTYGPVMVQNFIDRSHEFVFQDIENQLFLLTDEGEQVFSYPLESPIVSEVFQVDYYKNGKLQLLFATDSHVYIIDRLGNLLPGFPVNIQGGNITHLNLVDYDNNREYRFFIGTAEGNLFLLDKSGKALEGWNPKRIGGSLAVKPAHHRIAGVGDRMVALSSRGELYFFNRRGEPELGSPIRIGGGLGTDYILLERGSAQESRLVTITKEGEVVQVNLKGELTYRNQQVRPDRESQFHLVKDQKEDRYLFVIHEYNKVTVLNNEFKQLFSVNLFSDALDFQFYSYGTDKNIFVVIDRNQEFIYLYNLEGVLLNSLPIMGDQRVEIKYSGSQNDYTIYSISGNRFSEYRLPL